MGSLVPFLQFGPSNSAAANGVPMIEPKLEPLDEFTQADLQTSPVFSNPSPTGSSDKAGSSSGFSSRIAQEANASESLQNSNEANVYSEFYRISEMFRAAFAKRMQQYGDVAVVEDPDNSRAIVPVNSDDQSSSLVISRKKYQQRSSELVRVTDLKPEDQRYFRDVVRRTRMLYDSIRVQAIPEDERKHHQFDQRKSIGEMEASQLMREKDDTNQQCERHKKPRGDLKASQLMREKGLWLNRDKRIVGDIPGVLIGDLFFFRMELCVVGLHGQPQAGIDYVPASQSSNREPIATSIIVSGGYEDDEDAGDVLIYTGHGGQDRFSKQCTNQKLEGGNLALERSMHYGIEVRVIRGFKYAGSASGKVYVYDGLYRIIDFWLAVGKSGFLVFKYKLARIENQPEMGSSVLRFAQTLRTQPLVARPTGYISLDISRKKESTPVFLYNDIDTDQEPVYYDYLPKSVFPQHVYQHVGSGTGCECVAGCNDNCFCAMRNGGELAYDHNGILLRGKPVVFECGPHCHCPPSCRNRVSQKGVRKRFEVFRSRETGWGVRSLDLIQAGSFVCEYAGVVLTREQAQIFRMNGDSLVYPSRFVERWAEWGDLSQIHDDYVRPEHPSIPPLDFAMDVSRMRNIACYMSHSSSPNVLVQLVLYDHNNVCFPRLMLFAMENIPPLRELSIDYGVADEWTGKLAICN
ncbi:histone-lysine N-methyltransferase family member SUVH9-like [Ipomoea triloba]|uniref:histone-lysine N-methyltransferase family member SUVH9-like n=1 Tax=Ipomoea triloba TaxID=35885 RepID=UPI00125D6ABF|nr:histone-lysine N-methyltransferase family member SUVH9-like [Ipomoea triloba]